MNFLKPLWARVAVAGTTVALGGTGVYFAPIGGAQGQSPTGEQETVSTPDTAGVPPSPLPLGDGGSPAGGEPLPLNASPLGAMPTPGPEFAPVAHQQSLDEAAPDATQANLSDYPADDFPATNETASFPADGDSRFGGGASDSRFGSDSSEFPAAPTPDQGNLGGFPPEDPVVGQEPAVTQSVGDDQFRGQSVPLDPTDETTISDVPPQPGFGQPAPAPGELPVASQFSSANDGGGGGLSQPASLAPEGGFDSQPSPFGSTPAPAAPPASTAANQFDPGPSASPPLGSSPPTSLGSTAAPAALPPAEGALASPGERQLEGLQTPSLAIEKLAPEEIQINIPAKFEIRVRNTGDIPVKGVVVTDKVPQGTTLIKSTPEATQGPGGLLVWQFDSISAKDEQRISLELLPQEEGEIGSVAQVSFQTPASVRTMCTRPMLNVEHSAPGKVLIGEEVVLAITLSNPGSGETRNILIEENVPSGLSHSAGRLLEYEMESLAPGQERQLELVLVADAPGMVENVLIARADGELVAEHRVQVEVTAPQLETAIQGAAKRYLERQVDYQIGIQNPGTAAATNVNLVTHLPKGMQFVAADNKGQYDSSSHAVYWGLAQLPPGQQGLVTLTTLPVETGEQPLRVEATADLDLNHSSDLVTVVEGITALDFKITDLQDPIEVGSETLYEVRVSNQGTKSAANVQVAAQLPPELSVVSADGTTNVTVQDGSGGQQLLMEAIEELKPRGEAIYRVKVKGNAPGDHVINFQVGSDELAPVIKQEGTKVYADR